MKSSPSLLAAAGLLLTAGFSATAAPVLPFTETFSSNNSAWTQNSNAAANGIASGGVGGISDGYITTSYTVPTATGGMPVVARATGSNNASGGAFKGDYSSIDTVSFYVKSDATFALPIALRLGGAVGGTAITIDGGFLQPGSDWTLFTFDLVSTNSNIISYEGTPGATTAAKFGNATSNVANLQVFFYLGKPGYVPPVTATPVTLSVDSVRLAPVPEPHEYALGLALLLGAVIVLRRRRAAVTA